MICNVFYKNLEPMPQVEAMLEKKVSKLEELLSTFDDDTISLEVTFEKQARREEYYVSLTLSVPKKKLRSKDEGFDAFNAMNLAFDELLREVIKFKDMMKKENTYKIRRAEKRPRKTE